jgi:hypothetical protein
MLEVTNKNKIKVQQDTNMMEVRQERMSRHDATACHAPGGIAFPAAGLLPGLGTPGGSFPAISRPVAAPRTLIFYSNQYYQPMFYTKKREVMKRNFLQLTSAAALLLAVSIAGCSRENETAGEDQTVYLRVLATGTRAVATPVTGKTTLTTGHVFFTSGSGVITKTLEIGSTAYADANSTTVTTTQLDAGVPILAVPGNTSKVHVFGNVPSTVLTIPVVGESITTLLEAAIDVTTQHATNGDVSKVTLLGSGDIRATATPGQFTADVDVFPVAGRLEIGKITGNSTEIASFTVKGIYINNYYHSLGIDGTVLDEDDLKNNGSASATYAPSVSTPAPYPTDDNGVYFDATLSSNSNDGVVTPGTGQAWAYNLLAPKNPAARYFPHVVIELTSITFKAGYTAPDAYKSGSWYLTIKEVYKTNVTTPGETDYLTFTKGNIYQIADVPFSLGQLAATPEPGDKQVTVKVTVKAWEAVPVKPVI